MLDDSCRTTVRVIPAGWPNALLGIGLGLAALVFAFRSTVLELVWIWSFSTTYGYAWLVLPALGYVLWHHRQRFFAACPSWSLVGIVAAAACGIVWLAFDLLNIAVGRQFALVAAIPCIVLSAVGPRIFARLAPSLTLLGLLIPSGDVLLSPLKTLTLKIIVVAAALAQIPYSYDGQLITLGPNRYVVSEACAGLSELLMAVFLGLTFGLLIYRSNWKIGLLALFGIVCGIGANGARVVLIVMLDWMRGTQADLSSHVVFQWLALALVVTVMVAALVYLAPDREAPADRRQTTGSLPAGGRSLVAALCATLLAVAIPRIALAHIDLTSNQIGSQEISPGDLLPDRFAGWAKSSATPSWHPAPRTPIPFAVARYTRGDQEMEVFVAAAQSHMQKVTGYAIDLVGSGAWLEAKRRALAICGSGGCGEGHALELDREHSDEVRHVYYLYVLGGRIIGSALELQLRRALSGFLGGPQQVRIVAMASDGKAELRLADIAEALNALAADDGRR